MDYIQSLVVHSSRGVYNNGYNFGGTGVFHFFALCILFKNLFHIWGIFKPYCGGRDPHIEKALNATKRVSDCKSGTSFMGLAVNAGISIWNEECSAFPH